MDKEILTGQDPDKELIAEALSGKLASFARLIDKYNRKLYFLAFNMVNDRQDAEDLSQTAFVKAWQNLGKFREEANFQTWLIQILLNLCNSHLRHKNTVLRYIFPFAEFKNKEDNEETGIITQLADKTTEGSPEDKMLQSAAGEDIGAAIAELPQREREIFVLKHYNNLKINEIADMLGIAEGSVKSHIFRAVKKLQKRLKEYEEM